MTAPIASEIHERHAGDEDEHHLLCLVDSKPQDRERDQRRHRHVPPKERHRSDSGVEHAPGAGQMPSGTPMITAKSEADQDASHCGDDACQQIPIEPERMEAADHLFRRRQNHRRDQPSSACRASPPTTARAAAATVALPATCRDAEREEFAGRAGLPFAHVLLAGLERIHFDLHSPVLGLIQRIVGIRRTCPASPVAENWFGCKRRELPDDRLLHRIGAVRGELCSTSLSRHLSLHRGIAYGPRSRCVPRRTGPRVCPLRRSRNPRSDRRVLFLTAVVLATFLYRSHEFGKK